MRSLFTDNREKKTMEPPNENKNAHFINDGMRSTSTRLLMKDKLPTKQTGDYMKNGKNGNKTMRLYDTFINHSHFAGTDEQKQAHFRSNLKCFEVCVRCACVN